MSLTECPSPDTFLFDEAGHARTEHPFANPLSRRAFCPPDSTSPLVKLARALYSRIAAKEPLLAVLDDPCSAPAGILDATTVYYPQCPAAHAKALASASSIISFRKAPALWALANGVPAILLLEERELAELPDEFPVPCFAIGKDTPLDRIHATIEEELSRISLTRRNTDLPSALVRQRDRSKRRLRIACISNETYVPFFVGLMTNLREVHPAGLEVHLLCLDEGTRSRARELSLGTEIHCHRMEDLWSPSELEKLRRRSVAARAYSSKARLLRRLLALDSSPTFYCDLDLYFYGSPVGLIDELEGASTLLFPGFDPSVFEATRIWGMFQAGLLLVDAGAEDLLDWWALACLQRCNTVSKREYFHDDQGYLDLVPLLFTGVKIYWRGDQNVGFWSTPTVGMKEEPERPWMFRNLADEPVMSTHSIQVDRQGLYETKLAWDQISSFFLLKDIGSKPLDQLMVAHHARFDPRLRALLEWNSRIHPRPLLRPLEIPLSRDSIARVMRSPLGFAIAAAVNFHKSLRERPLLPPTEATARYHALVRERILKERSNRAGQPRQLTPDGPTGT